MEIISRDINKVNNCKALEREKSLVKENKKIHKSMGYFFVKRYFDFFAAFVMVIMLSPILLITALLIKTTSKGPVFFKDKRIGRNGKNIRVYKFRSMYVDAESRLKEYLTKEQYQQWMIERKIENDPRITKIGKILRKTSIDELPQLLNILGGSMSFVGPRPITQLEFDENYTAEEKTLLQSAKPGLTGFWQVYGRSDVEYKSGRRQSLELEYFKHRGLWFDFMLIIKTVPAVLKHRGAK